MAVPEQTPYIEHTGNGATKSFALKFQCDSKDHLIVLVDEIEPPIATWSLSSGNIVFTTAPASGSKITLQRNTPFSRTVDYQSYNNSFRPPAVNKDFDWIWWKLQELGVADWILGARIDALKNYVDDRDDELRAYLMEEIRKQGVALDQLDEYYNYLMQRLAQIAVDKGWSADFVVDGDKTQKQINDSITSLYNPLNLKYTQQQLATAFTTSLNALIQKVSLSGGGTISIPDGGFSINPAVGGIVLKDNIHLRLGGETTIKNINSTATTYQIIRADGVVNASVSGGTLNGNKTGNPSTTGEQGHGIYIKGGRDISINDVAVKDTWGDGVYIGRLNASTPINEAVPRDIKLSNVTVDGARRQGLTVITVDGCTVDNFTAKNINTTNPKAGVDIEPNYSDEYIKDLVFNNLVTENTGAGLVVNCLTPVFADVNSDKQVIDVTINGHIDNNSNVAVGIDNKNGYVKGRVLVNNANYRGQTGRAISLSNHADGIELTVVDPNVELSNSTSNFVYIGGLNIGETAIPVGGLSVIRPNFKRSVTSDVYDFNLTLHSSFAATGYKNISIIDPKRVARSDGRIFGEGKPITNFSISDIHNVSKNVITANTTDANFGYSRTIALSKDVTSNITYRFNSIAKGRKLRLVNESTSFNFVLSFNNQIAVKGLVNTRGYSKELLITIKPGGFIDIDAINSNDIVITDAFNFTENYSSESRQITSATSIPAGESVTYSINTPLLDQNSAVIGFTSPRVEGVNVEAFASDGVTTAIVKNSAATPVTLAIGSYVHVRQID